jgi:glycosyltransferase involved in cell wall biosynthesis
MPIPNPLNILHITPSMDPQTGGVCQAIKTIITGLSQLNTHNEVVCLDDPGAAYLKMEGVKMYGLGKGKSSWGYSPLLSKWVRMRMEGFDIVIVHGLWQYHSYVVSSLWRSTKKKKPYLFVMPHGMLDPYFQKAPDRKLKAIRNWFIWKLIENKLIKRADGILFTCHEECRLARLTFPGYKPAKELVTGLGVSAPPVFTISMGEAFQKKAPGLMGEKYILYLGRIHEKKGVDLLIKAYTAILKNYPLTKPPKLVIAGPGAETVYGKKIVEMAAVSNRANDSIHFTGMLMGDEKWGAIYGCEAFILPSHQENFGIAVAEAQACGKPVLISDKVNIWREIKSAGSGLVEEDTLAGTEKLLTTWIEMNQQKKSSFEQKSKNSFSDFFAISAVAAQFLEVLKEVVVSRQRVII